jgi:NAD(P)-dependent dehydrogenase (short-subunit alcohol dehydrogenase family)
MNSANSLAIVTGGTGALGSRVAHHFTHAGVSVAIPVRSEKALTALPSALEPLKEKLYLRRADLTSERETKQFVHDVVDRFGRIDYLVAAAGGYAGGKKVEQTPPDEWEKQLSLNLTSLFLMCRAVLPHMRERGFGRIVTIAAMPALTSGAERAAYAVSKRGVISLTEAIADEVKRTGITANAIAPSIIVTEANRDSMPDAETSWWVTPDEIATLVLFLCSPDARSLSGNVIKAFGGV